MPAALLLADQGAPWPDWIGLPANLFAVALLGWLLLTGRLVRREDCDARVQAEVERGDERVAAEQARLGAEVEGLKGQLTLQTDRVAALVEDRGAWRSAHGEEVVARNHAEFATRELLEATNVTVRLLDALERSVVGKEGG